MAALICSTAYRAIGLCPEIKFIQYGTKEEKELTPEPGQLFVDFAPPNDRWEEWKDVDPIVLDHHETREKVTRGLGGIYGHPKYSGASLAFMHVMVPLWNEMTTPRITLQEWAKFAILAQIRDTWQSDSPAWFSAASFGQGLSFFGSRSLLAAVEEDNLDLHQVLDIGKKVYERILRKAEHIADSAYTETISLNGESYKLAFFNSTEKNISEVAHHLLEECECDLAAGYFSIFQDGKFRIIVSLRTKGRLNARKIAEVWNGGGHPPAAGFKMDGPRGFDALAHTFGDIVGYVKSGITDTHRKD